MGACLTILKEIFAQAAANSDSAQQTSTQSQTHSAGAQQQHAPHKPTTTSTSGTGSATATSSSGTSPIYASLPANAEKVTVRNVYDGDTLTLTDERRVRFLGVDTPEVKENQPFAQEAKAYTKQVICGSNQHPDIWLTYEPGQPKEDHYGRLLAFVWVKDESGHGGYLCVNEGIIHAGYATAYTPNANAKMHNWDKFIALQTDARAAKRGMWSNSSKDDDKTVYKTANGSAFHQRNCEHLAEIRNLTELKVSDALSRGLHPCRTCSAN